MPVMSCTESYYRGVDSDDDDDDSSDDGKGDEGKGCRDGNVVTDDLVSNDNTDDADGNNDGDDSIDPLCDDDDDDNDNDDLYEGDGSDDSSDVAYTTGEDDADRHNEDTGKSGKGKSGSGKSGRAVQDKSEGEPRVKYGVDDANAADAVDSVGHVDHSKKGSTKGNDEESYHNGDFTSVNTNEGKNEIKGGKRNLAQHDLSVSGSGTTRRRQ